MNKITTVIITCLLMSNSAIAAINNSVATYQDPVNLSKKYLGEQVFVPWSETVYRINYKPNWTPNVRVAISVTDIKPLPNSTAKEFAVFENRSFFLKIPAQKVLSILDIANWKTSKADLTVHNSTLISEIQPSYGSRFTLKLSKKIKYVFTVKATCEVESVFTSSQKIPGAEVISYQLSVKSCTHDGTNQNLVGASWLTYDIFQFDKRTDISAIQVRGLSIGKTEPLKGPLGMHNPSLKESKDVVLMVNDEILLQLFKQLNLGVPNKEYLWKHQDL